MVLCSVFIQMPVHNMLIGDSPPLQCTGFIYADG